MEEDNKKQAYSTEGRFFNIAAFEGLWKENVLLSKDISHIQLQRNTFLKLINRSNITKRAFHEEPRL